MGIFEGITLHLQAFRAPFATRYHGAYNRKQKIYTKSMKQEKSS